MNEFKNTDAVKIQDTDNSKCWGGFGAKWTLTDCWWEREMVQPLWKSVWQFLIKLKMLLAYNPAVPLFHTYSKELETYVHTKNLHR